MGRGLVVAVGVDVVSGQDVTGLGVTGDDVGVVDEHEDGLAGVGAADTQPPDTPARFRY